MGAGSVLQHSLTGAGCESKALCCGFAAHAEVSKHTCLRVDMQQAHTLACHNLVLAVRLGIPAGPAEQL
jgi:hypothetical protein